MATAAKTQGKHKNGKKARHSEVTDSRPVNNGTRPPMTAKVFERELEALQVELVKLQEWVKVTGAKICVLFEGRDTAGKGGTIKRITERVSPRVFRVVALPAPTEREKSQMYIQRYLPAPPGGRRGRPLRPELVQPRRGRAGDGLCHRRGSGDVLRPRRRRGAGHRSTPASSWSSTGSRSSMAQQTGRFEERINDPRKTGS